MGANTRFGTVECYNLSVDTTPPVILTPKKRKALYDRWINPDLPRSGKDDRAADARYWGEWEQGSGLLFDSDVWQRQIHVIPPLWDEGKIPKHLTLWRAIDHAPRVGINVCAWFAVGPKRAVMYRLLYERGLEISEFAKKIIELSHNKQVFDENITDPVTRSIHPYHHEEQIGEVFYNTVMDSRSMAQELQNETIASIYERCGIRDIQKASGQDDIIQIPRLKSDWLWIDFAKDHPWNKMEDGTPMKGCPKLFVFEGRCNEFIMEIEGLQKAKPDAAGLINKKNPHHSIDATKYWASDSPCWMGDEPKEEEDEERSGNRFTGY